MLFTRWLLPVLLCGACGRWGFSGNPVDGNGNGDGGNVDAPPAGLVDLTAATPLLVTPSPLSNDCGRYLMSFPDYGLAGEYWHPTVVMVGTTVYFAIPCKYGDMGAWSLGLANYTPTGGGAQTAQWIDGDAGTVGVNEFVKPSDPAPGGLPIVGLGNLALATNGTSLFGLGATNYNNGQSTVPVLISAPEQLTSMAYDVTRLDAFDLATNDNTWHGATAFERSILYRDGAFNIFTMHSDAPNNTNAFVAVHQTMTGADVEFASSPLLTGSMFPVVAGDANHVFLVTIEVASGYYVLREASTIAGLAAATPQPLDLARFQGGVGAWNHDLFADTPRGEPRIFGAVVANGSLLMFSLAGDTDYVASTAPYTAPRAIGVLSQPVD